MSDNSIQQKVNELFVSTLFKSSDFTPQEVEEIKNEIETIQKTDKLIEKLLIIIGGTADENT